MNLFVFSIFKRHKHKNVNFTNSYLFKQNFNNAKKDLDIQKRTLAMHELYS